MQRIGSIGKEASIILPVILSAAKNPRVGSMRILRCAQNDRHIGPG